MAELLVKAIDASNLDPIKDAATYKINDIILVKPDNFEWSENEKEGAFYIVKIPEIDVEDFENLYTSEIMEVKYTATFPETSKLLTVASNIVNGIQARGEDTIIRKHMLMRRIYKFDRSLLSQPQEDELSKNNIVTLDSKIAKTFFINKLDGSKLV